MGILVSNMLATGAWMAFLSVLAIIGIVVAGGFIVALLGRMVLSLITPKQDVVEDNSQYDYRAPAVNYNQSSVYVTQAEQSAQPTISPVQTAEVSPKDDYAYAVDVDQEMAKKEEELLNNELKGTKSTEDDGFFDEFMGNDDVRFGDDDLMGMIDEISQDVLDEEQEDMIAAERQESENNKSILDQYSIDDYLNDTDDSKGVDEEEIADDMFEGDDPFAEDKPVVEQLDDMIDQQTMDEINTLKEQIKEIVESMEDNKNQNETFNQQLINILNELKEANKKDVRTVEDAEREIYELKQQLEASRIEMEEQTQAKIAEKDDDAQQRLQEQLDASNAEIESLKAQLSNILAKMENPEDDEAMEKEPVVEEEPEDEISALRKEVGEMIASMREETRAQTNVNNQLLEILASMKEENLKTKEQATIETNEDATEQVAEWKEDLEATEKELTAQFKEELLHKSEEEQKIIRNQMESYNEEISDLKDQLAFLMEQFKTQTESAKNENKALLEQLEAERKERIRLEQEKLEAEKESILTAEEMADLYSEATDDFASDEAVRRLEDELEDSKQEIDDLRAQLKRLTNYVKEHKNSLAEELDVNEVRSVDFDVDQINQVTASDVELIVNEKIIDSLAEIEGLKDELVQTKQEIENQYKDQLANVKNGMEYDRVSKLQESAEKVDGLNEKLAELVDELKAEKENIRETSEKCISEMESLRQEVANSAKQGKFEDSNVAVIGPKGNKVALVAKDDVVAELVTTIDIETAKQISYDELSEVVASRLAESNKAIEALKDEIAELKKDLAEKVETAQPEVPVVRSPLFDVEMIKTITAKEVEKKVQERLAEAMKEIEAMKAQLEVSKKEIERQYKEELAINRNGESEVKDKLKGSAAEVIELKEQLIDLTEQIELEHQEAKQNSQEIAVQLDQDRKEKQEIAKQQLAIAEQSESSENAEVMVIGPKDNQVALVTGVTMLSEYVGEDDIPTIDIETVKQLTEQEIEEKVQIRMASSIIEIEELKKQILNLSIQIQEIKGKPTDDDEKPMVFHYSTEEAYLERLAILEERLKSAKKDLKINNKELNPLEKVKRTLERDKIKLRRKYAIVAKKKVALYGVNNYVDIDKDKAEKLAQELELLEGLKLSVNHCEEVMNANIDRYPILVHTNKILKENISNIESDIATLNKELAALRAKNGEGEND